MASLWIVSGIAVLLLFAIGVLRRAGQPIAYRGLHLTEINRFVDSFLEQAGAGSVLSLERESGPGFLQIAVVNRRGDRDELEFGLPDTHWSHAAFDSVRKALEASGCLCILEADSSNAVVPGFLRARFHGHRAELTSQVLEVFSLAAGCLGFNSEARYTLRMSATISPEYQRELADRLDSTTRGSRIARTMAAWLRRSSERPGGDQRP